MMVSDTPRPSLVVLLVLALGSPLPLGCGRDAGAGGRAEHAGQAAPSQQPAETAAAGAETTPGEKSPTTEPKPTDRAPAPSPGPTGQPAQAASIPEDASIYSPEPVVDLGEILQGEKRHHTFVVGNRGEEPVVIKAVQPSCGCTIARVVAPDGREIDPRRIAPGTDVLTLGPGEQMKVEVEFNSQGQPAHRLQKTIMVISSDDKNPALRLTMNMNITTAVQIDPNPLQFGEVTRGQKVTKRVWIRLDRLPELEITGVDQKPDYLEVVWKKEKDPQGRPAIALDVTLGPGAPIGYVSPVLLLRTNNEKLPTLQVQLYANVKSEVVFDTGNKLMRERLDFAVIPYGETRERVVEIRNTNPEVPYYVSDVEVQSAYGDKITAELETVEEGKHYRVRVRTSPDLDARFFRGKLIIRSPSEVLPEKEIFFHGWVKKT